MSSYFSRDMSSTEARLMLFTLIDRKNKEEFKKIQDEYDAVLPEILEREAKEHEGYLVGCDIAGAKKRVEKMLAGVGY